VDTLARELDDARDGSRVTKVVHRDGKKKTLRAALRSMF
jgi:hypothetical protein